MIKYFFVLLLFSLQSCGSGSEVSSANVMEVETSQKQVEVQEITAYQINESAEILSSRFPTPNTYVRTKVDTGSFGSFLRKLNLKPHGSIVKTYDGDFKVNDGVYEAVVDLPIGEKDLHQCADAVMRLRADYLWQSGRYDEIHFNFTNGFRVDYSKWMEGYRVVVEGNKTYWKLKAAPSNTYESYWKYMELIFMYAGTLSLSKELESVEQKSMEIGDVFIQGGSPGHAVIVVDVCENTDTGEKLFMLAQSYMPAQELQVLSNPSSEDGSPWYNLSFEGVLATPEWVFNQGSLKRFGN